MSRSLERGSNPTALAGDHPELVGTRLERQLGVFSILLCQQGAPKPLGGTPKSRLKHLKGWPSIRWGVPSPSGILPQPSAGEWLPWHEFQPRKMSCSP